jgi:AraC family transcriptional regulator
MRSEMRPLAHAPVPTPDLQRSAEQAGSELSPPLSLPSATSSRDRPWRGIAVDVHPQPGPGSVYSPSVDQDILGMRLSGTVRLGQRRDGTSQTSIAVPGYLTLHPRGMDSHWSWDAAGSIVVMRVPHKLLLEAAEANVQSSPAELELRNCFGARDLFVERIALTLVAETERAPSPVQELISEGLSCALAAHLIDRFNTRPVRYGGDTGKLRASALHRVLAYMDDNIGKVVTLDTLAELANVSRFHFARSFRRSTGMSPMEYLEQSRLAQARELIRSGRYSMAEIGALLGFADQSHFTRRFRRFTGCTPAVYARECRESRTAVSSPLVAG